MDLHITLEDFDGNIVTVLVTNFRVGDNDTNYRMHFDQVLAKDIKQWKYLEQSFSELKNLQFSTYDHETTSGNSKCAKTYGGGWWYNPNGCVRYSNLNGLYLEGVPDTPINAYMGMIWHHFRGNKYSLKKSTMKIGQRTGFWCDEKLGNYTSYDRCDSFDSLAVNSGECDGTVCCIDYKCHRWDHIDSHLGKTNNGLHLQGYYQSKAGGVSIATGIDLNSFTFKQLREWRVHEDLIQKLEPYLEKNQRELAKDHLKAAELRITLEEGRALDEAIRSGILRFNGHHGRLLSQRGAAVLGSLYLLCGYSSDVGGAKCFVRKCRAKYIENFLQKSYHYETDTQLRENMIQHLLCLISAKAGNHMLWAMANGISVLYGHNDFGN